MHSGILTPAGTTLGPLVSVKMGVKQWILVSDPNLAYELFNVNGRYSSERPYSTYMSKYYAMNCKGLTSGNPCNQWKKTRAAGNLSKPTYVKRKLFNTKYSHSNTSSLAQESRTA